MHLHAATTFECSGTLIGAGLVGTFHEWRSGDNERRDEQLGLRRERIVRTPSAIWITENQEAPHEVTGTGSKRRIVQDFDDSEAFTRGAKDIHFVDRERLPDGRFAYRLMIQSRDGAPFDVLIDSINWLVDEESYSALDGSHEAITFSEYRVVDGVLVPYIRVDSRGGSEPDVVSTVTKVIVGAPIADSTFVPLERAVVEVDKPVSVPLEILSGFPFAIVTIDGKNYRFIVDSGSQANVVDEKVAAALGVSPVGTFEVSGAKSLASQGIVALPPLHLGPLTLPSYDAAVLDLHEVMQSSIPIDGVLGYPFFASAEVRIDASGQNMTVARPGSLSGGGLRLPVDIENNRPEIDGAIDRVSVKLLLDTGNTNELLVFRNFVEAHPGLVEFSQVGTIRDQAIGGSMRAFGAYVDEIELGPERLYNRLANVIFATSGTFADANVAGNVGFGSLRQYVATFDLVNHAVYLQHSPTFNDGRGRIRANPADQVIPQRRS